MALKNLLLSIALITTISACSKKRDNASIVTDIQQIEKVHTLAKPAQPADWAQHMTPSTKEVKTQITFSKSQIFDRDFLYGADLQHSTIFDEESKLYDQVYSMGHEIAFFRKVGNTLQLVADQSWKFESDVNKPERLINEFPIYDETSTTITVEINKPSPVLRQMFWGSQTDLTRSSWIRSVEFDPNGNYLLIESSIETVKGQIVEHMESLFPRENLVSEKTHALWLTEDEELASRFEFLAWFPVFRTVDGERIEAPAAFKYNLSKGKAVKWYVTDNIPDDILLDVKNSVEGWNRYFQKMWKTDGLIFAGKLPLGVKLGDPRYNVIVWDNVQDGDAAYESQAVDPLTGIQSHSNIYIPYAWLKTATEYWTDGQFAEKLDEKSQAVSKQAKWLSSKQFMGSPLRFGCIRDLSKVVIFGGQKSEDDLKNLAREVLKGVIFHEVGHALGMDHNFKGSLINENGQFTSSIMDYNHYNLEKAVFDDVESASGPLLEYDRQFLEALYNNGKGLKDSVVLPSCNDTDADNTEGGVDPLCSRYDAGQNPYTWMTETIHLIEKPTYQLGLFKSLSEALHDLQTSLGKSKTISSEEDFTTIRDDFFARQTGLFDYYAFAGAHSLRYMTSVNLKALKGFTPNILSGTLFKESNLREQTMQTLDYIYNLQTVPVAPATALTQNFSIFVKWAKTTPYYSSLDKDGQYQVMVDIDQLHKNTLDHIVNVTFSKVRQRLAANLSHDPSNPYYFHAPLDTEAYVINLLQQMAITSTQGEFNRSIDERKAAIVSFMTFVHAGIADYTAVEVIKSALKVELKKSVTTQERDNIRSLLALF